jgi:hypothetical protein
MRSATLAAAITVAVVALHAPRADAGRGTLALKYLADDTTAVVLIDVAKGRKSAVFKKGLELASDKQPLLATLKLDKNVDTVIGAGSGTNNGTVVVVLEGRLDAIVAETKKRSTATTTHAGIAYWTTAEGELALIDKRLVFASTGTMPTVIDRSKDKKRAKGPGRVRSWLGAAQPGASLVVAMVPDASASKDLAKRLDSAPTSATLSLGTATNLTIDARLQFADDAGADKAKAALDSVLTSDSRNRIEAFVGKDFADSLQSDRDGTVVRVAGVMSPDEIDKVIGVARMLM